MGFVDRVRAWLKGEGKGAKRRSPSPSTDKATRAASKELGEFMSSRTGVEAFVEPATAIYPTTLLVVAADGEYLRRPVGDRARAQRLCNEHEVPLYDAAKVGYPKRMRDYDQGIRRKTVSLEELPPWPGDDPRGPGSA